MTAAKAASTSAVAALVLAAVWLFWPASLGGGATYVSTHGTSMEPGFRTGDLAVLRAADAYAVGDVVAYRSESLGTIVMHRIVSGDAAGFVTQGDNNDWLDEDRPTAEEVLGRLFLRVPRGGLALDGLRSPAVLATMAVAGSAAFALVTRWPVRRPGRPTSRGRPARGQRRPGARFPVPIRARARQFVVGSGVVALVAGGACVVLAGLPATQTEAVTATVTRLGQFGYSGTAVPGTTYPTGVVETGDTIWTRLVDGLTVTFTDTVDGPGLADVRGTLRLDVSVTAADGWSALVASGAEVPVVDGTATATVAVDTAAAATLLSSHYAEIGGSGGQARLTVAAVTDIAGTARGQDFADGSPTPLTFAMDATSLRPDGEPGTGFTRTSDIPVQVEEVVPRTLPALGVEVPIGVARAVAAGVLALALLALGAGAWIGRAPGGPADQFLVRHADRIVPVLSVPPAAAVIDVDDVASLHRIAERFDTVVLHHASADGHVFAVRDADATYRLVLPPGARHRRGKPPVPAAPAPAAPAPAAPASAAPPPAAPASAAPPLAAAAPAAPAPGPDAPDATVRLPRARAAPPGAVPAGGTDATSPLRRVA